jgi:hypothetical protein
VKADCPAAPQMMMLQPLEIGLSLMGQTGTVCISGERLI